MILSLVLWFIRRKNLSDKDRNKVITTLLESIDAPPLQALISVDENRRVLVNGKPLSVEQIQALRESASAVLNSTARNLIHEQVRYAAIDTGFLKNGTGDLYSQLFYKAALWTAQEEDNLLRALASEDIHTLT